MSIKAVDLNYVYGNGTAFEQHALFDVNFEIQDGEFVGIIGHTGSGKSTLIQHLNGLLRATSGAIYYDGENQHEILKQLATSEIVIATRFHAVVLGLVSQCRVLPVLYSNKTKNILKDLNINGNMADIKELDINGVYKTVELNELEIRKLREKSEKHFEKLDKYINE